MPSGGFHNRVAELDSFERLLLGPASGIFVVVGPPSCGKSELFKELVRRREASGRAPVPVYVNCRDGDNSSPNALARNLLERVKAVWRLDVAGILRLIPTYTVKLPFFNLTVNLPRLSEPTDLQSIAEAFMQLIKDAKARRTHGDALPVLVIDEANDLISWEKEHAAELRQLLKFFVLATKEANLAHVVLISSDTFLAQWLHKFGIKERFRNVFVLGDLPEQSACDFFSACALPQALAAGAPEWKPDTHWARVYQVCGGNPGDLLRVVSFAARAQSWEQACESMLDSAGSVVAGARTPTDGEWTSAQYDAVLSAVARSPHGAVSVSTLLRAMPPPPPGCGGADAAAALAALQARDLIFRRSRDGMTHDLHPDAFDPVSREDVFVLASAAHLRIAKQLVEAEELGAENE